MKIFIALILSLLSILALSGCGDTQNATEPPDAKANKWGVTLVAENVTPTSLTLVCHHTGGENVAELFTGTAYVIEKFNGRAWVSVDLLPQEYEVVWTAVALLIPKEDTVSWNVNWEALCGTLPVGNYRIGKEIMNFRETGNHEEETVYAEFTVESPPSGHVDTAVEIKSITLNSSRATDLPDVEEPFFEDDSRIYIFGNPIIKFVIVEYTDGSREGVKSALENGNIQITDLDKYGISYFSEPKLIDCIIDLTESGDIATDDALEGFYTDGTYSYYFSSIRSDYVIVYYKDGTEQTVKDALADGRILISDLDLFGISYHKMPAVTNGNAEVPDDFSFSLTWNCYGISSYDSSTGKLIKTTDATNPDDYVTTCRLTEDELTYVYDLISSLDVSSYPDVYDPENGMSDPSATLILTVRANGIEKTIASRNISLIFTSKSEKGQAFLDTCSAISDLLTSTEAWKSLPDYEFLYD